MGAFQKWQPTAATPATNPEPPEIDSGGLRTPKGFRRIEAYYNDSTGRLVICGDPPDEEEIPEGDERAHDCDWMGCGSCSHVLARIAMPWLRGWLVARPVGGGEEKG